MTSDEKKKSDTIDIDILNELTNIETYELFRKKKSIREISKNLERSPITIGNHIKELENKEIIKEYGAQIDYEKLGYDITAIIELTISKGKMIEVENQISHMPNIFAVYDITGTYDALVLARFKKRNELSDLVKKINSNEFVIRTNTHLILNIIKEESNFRELLEYEKGKPKD